MDDTPDMPLENFGAVTEVAAPPAAEPEAPQGDSGEQTTQPTDGSGSEGQQEAQPVQPEDNPKPEETESEGRPEKRDRLQNRFGELTGRLKERDSYIEQLEAQMARAQAMQGVQPLQPDEDGQYSVEAIQRNAQQMAQAAATSEVQVLRSQMEREAIANRMDAEGTQIEKMLEEKGLDDPYHTDTIRQEIEERIALAQYNPNALKQISPKAIADRYIKGIEAERRRATSTTVSNVQNLQSEAAVTPSSAPTAVDPNSDEALEARVAEIKF